MPFRHFPDPPIPVSATWESGSTFVFVTFDQPLADGPLDAGNWSAVTDPPQSVGFAEVVGGVAQVRVAAAPTSVTSVSYDPPPFDVVAAGTGHPAEAFSEFPVSQI